MQGALSRDRSADHVPVMLDRCVELLAPALDAAGAVVVDATLGLGGHSRGAAAPLPPARLVGIDRDPRRCAARASGWPVRRRGSRLVHAVYDELPTVLADLGLRRASHGVLFDLGVSSLQLDEAGRGFAYAQDAPLDMRMDPTRGITAADVLNTYPAADLARVLREYGEERFARGSRARSSASATREPFTHQRPAGRAGPRRDPGSHRGAPAATRPSAPSRRCGSRSTASSRCWSAALPAAVDALAVGGRIAVLSYHSLEDRIVKRAFAAGATQHRAAPGCRWSCPSTRRCCGCSPAAPSRRRRRRGAGNPRAASARLRAAERIRERGMSPRSGARLPRPDASVPGRPVSRRRPALRAGSAAWPLRRAPPGGGAVPSSCVLPSLLAVGLVGLLVLNTGAPAGRRSSWHDLERETDRAARPAGGTRRRGGQAMRAPAARWRNAATALGMVPNDCTDLPPASDGPAPSRRERRGAAEHRPGRPASVGPRSTAGVASSVGPLLVGAATGGRRRAAGRKRSATAVPGRPARVQRLDHPPPRGPARSGVGPREASGARPPAPRAARRGRRARAPRRPKRAATPPYRLGRPATGAARVAAAPRASAVACSPAGWSSSRAWTPRPRRCARAADDAPRRSLSRRCAAPILDRRRRSARPICRGVRT